MEAYLQAFVNFKQDNWARILSMTDFAFNNAKNTSTNHSLFELDCGFYPGASYKEDVNPRSQSKLANELTNKFRELMTVYRENLQHTQNLQKQ